MLETALNSSISLWDVFLNCDTTFVIQVLFSLGIQPDSIWAELKGAILDFRGFPVSLCFSTLQSQFQKSCCNRIS